MHMQSVLRFFKELYFSSNSVLKVLSKVSCNQKYCQQFQHSFLIYALNNYQT